MFSQEQFCRGCCEPEMSYDALYLVHPNSDKKDLNTKKDVLKTMQAWFLNEEDLEMSQY